MSFRVFFFAVRGWAILCFASEALLENGVWRIVGDSASVKDLCFCSLRLSVMLVLTRRKFKTASSSSPATGIRKIDRSAMGVAYASGSRQTALKQRRPLPRRGQVKAAIAASWLHTLASIVHGARSVALSHSHSGWSFRSN